MPRKRPWRSALLESVTVSLWMGCAHAPPPVPPDLQEEVERVRRAAERLVALERLGAASARQLPLLRHPDDPPVLGMLALRTSWAQSGSVAFVTARSAGGVQVLYEARVVDELQSIARMGRLAEPRPLVGEEQDVWRARETVLAAFVDGRCGAELDVLVLPRAAPDDTFDVYPLPAPRVKWATEHVVVKRRGHLESSTDGSMELVVAGQRRFHVSGDGSRVLEWVQMGGDCQVRSLDHVRGNGDVIEITDLAAEMPNEAQLLDSAVLGWKFRITTRRGVWDVSRNATLPGRRPVTVL